MSASSKSLHGETNAYTLEASREYCCKLAKRAAKNFYFSFLTLPAEHYRAMCALYAFMRICDDLGDETSIALEERRVALQQWRGDVTAALAGDPPAHIALPAVCEMVERFDVPHEYLLAAIDGVTMDLGPVEFATFDELSNYCYHVAGVVGLSCIEIWSYRGEEARAAAVDCGLALQLTNILRDIKEDAAMNRVYLPQEDLQRFGYTADDIRQETRDERFQELMKFQVARARSYYERGWRLFDDLEPIGQPILDAMLRIYGGLLDEIESRNFDVYSSRTRLSTPRKLVIAGSAMLRHQWRRLTMRRSH